MTYIINWFVDGDFERTEDYAFKNYTDAKEFAEALYKRETEMGVHYDILKLKDVLGML